MINVVIWSVNVKKRDYNRSLLIQVLRLRLVLGVFYFHANLMVKNCSPFFHNYIHFFMVSSCLIRLNEACVDAYLTVE